jgi:F-box interacting protein
MAQVSSDGEDDPNDIVLTSLSLTDETITSQPQLPTLPYDVLPEILCRLPVKLLIKLRCLCKFFNSLISDPKFGKKHLQLSTKHLVLKCRNMSHEWLLYDSPIPSILSTSTVVTQTQLYPPNTLTNGSKYVDIRCSCDGIFCGILNSGSYFLWNPSITKFKLLPPFDKNAGEGYPFSFSISFGYDHFIDNYKVVVVSEYKVSVNTLGTDYWRKIQDIPYNYFINESGTFVSGTVNWLTYYDSCMHFILSLDLEKESNQMLWLPDSVNNDSRHLGVLRDCLCLFSTSDMFVEVWIMNECGKEESWTKLYTVPSYLQDQDLEARAVLCISEDDQLLVEFDKMRSFETKLVVYDSKTGTLNIHEFQNNYYKLNPQVYIESIISP